MKIKNYSRNSIIKMIKDELIDWENNNLISINTNCYDSKELEEMKSIVKEYGIEDRVLLLQFDDADFDLHGNTMNKSDIKYFNEDDAEKIIKFIKKTNEDHPKELMVHCSAGISRSAAVSVFANEFANKFLENNPGIFEINEKYGFERAPFPNMWVLKILRKVAKDKFQY